jgi:hypothetical protein
MAAPEWIIRYKGIDGSFSFKIVRERANGWPEYYSIRELDPDASLYLLRQDGSAYPD